MILLIKLLIDVKPKERNYYLHYKQSPVYASLMTVFIAHVSR